MITLKPYRLRKSLHLQIILRSRLKQSWWLYLLLLGVGIYSIPTMGTDNISTFLVVAAVAFPASTALSALIHTQSKGNQHLYATRHLQLKGDRLYISNEDGQQGELLLRHLSKVEHYIDYWLLRQSSTAYYIIPKAAFEDEAQEKAFELHLSKYTQLA